METLRPELGAQGALERAVALLISGVVSRRRGEVAASEARDGRGQAAARAVLADAVAGVGAVDAHWLGEAYQRALDVAAEGVGGRKAGGVFYTPRPLVRHILDRTLGPVTEKGGPLPRVWDPACGCGAFLVEAARWLRERRPGEPGAAVLACLHGSDIDPLAAELCQLALWLELCEAEEPLEAAGRGVRVGDSLLGEAPCDPLDAAVGNPPFLSQLASGTARSREAAAALRGRFGRSVGAYTDPAALFLQLGMEAVRRGGRVGMVLPVSVLSSRDGAAVRARVDELGALRDLWLDTEGAFDAGVRTVIVVAERGASGGAVSRSRGEAFDEAQPRRQPDAASWGPLGAELLGVPPVRLASAAMLETLAEITAGFRDEYYAIVGALEEAPGAIEGDALAVASVGVIEPFRLCWGEGPIRLGGRRWARPVVRPGAPGTKLAAVIAQQRRPKLLVATQSRVIEAAPDAAGAVVAVTPAVMVFPREPGDLWRIGAVLGSPVVTAWAAAEAFGAARSLDAIKPSAALLRRAPLPRPGDHWRESAERFRALCEGGHAPAAGDLEAFGRAACAAYGLAAPDTDAVVGWWLARQPRTLAACPEEPPA